MLSPPTPGQKTTQQKGNTMFARFKTPGTNDEINVNVTQVSNFVPSTNEGKTILHFVNGSSVEIAFSPQAVRGAFKRALAPATTTNED